MSDPSAAFLDEARRVEHVALRRAARHGLDDDVAELRAVARDLRARAAEIDEVPTTAIGRFTAACPDGKVPFIVTLRVLDDFEPGDVVLGHRPDNGQRGRLRVRAGVVVGRYIPAEAAP
jgi:hypothetical protein